MWLSSPLAVEETAGAAEETSARPSVALLAGYALETRRFVEGGTTSYGIGLGCRAGVTLPQGLYVGGVFVDHLGSSASAEDATRSSTYWGAYHVAYAGPEIGRDFDLSRFLIRPYAGFGGLLAVQRTDVRQWQQRGDHLGSFLAAGLLVELRLGWWRIGLDARASVTTDGGWNAWVPSAFLVVGHGG
jgi:hypothetical protein